MGQPRRKEHDEDEKVEAVSEKTVEKTTRGDETPWVRPAIPSRRALGVLVGLVVLFNLPLIHYYLIRGDQPATVKLPFTDDYSDRTTVEKNYWSTGGHWRTVDGTLLSPGVKNNPLWLKAKLPQNVAVEFDARSQSPEGDIKVEIFGDGLDHASGYVLIHGGWNNQISIIARRDEHGQSLGQFQQAAQQQGKDWKALMKEDTRLRVEAAPFPVQIGKTYRWRIERRGGMISWFIDGNKFMEFDDPKPLVGDKHDRFGFSSWEAQLYFDNLKVEPL